MNPTEKQDNPGFLTKEAFEKLLTKAAQPMPKQPAQEAEQTSESHQRDD